MTSGPAISVVIPHFNNDAGLARCLEAITAQDYPADKVEILVIDNGSAQLPVAVCSRFPSVTLAEEKTPGPGPARSKGAAMARAPILAFIDSDCLAQPGWLAAIAAHFSQDDAADIIGGDVGIAVQGEKMTAIEAYESVFGYRMKLYIERDHYAATCNMAVRRSVFQAVGPFGGLGMAEDMDWGRRAHALGHRIAFVQDMRILTPARSDFAELTRKWDRHIGHDFAALGGDLAGKLKWVARSLALAISPVREIPRIVASDRLNGPVSRLSCGLMTTRIRSYRCAKMLSLLLGSADADGMAARWRKQED